jgi:ABC-type lipoprotein release transport system permease subunit
MILLKMAWNNIFSHKLKTFIIGGIIAFGTVVAILGNSFVDSISKGMERGITASATGHIQIYSKDAPEKLAVYGSVDGNMPDIGHVNDFAAVRDSLMAKIPEIKTIVPMGTSYAMLNPGNLLDVKIEQLRALYHAASVDKEKIQELKAHIREIILDIEKSLAQSQDKMIFFDEKLRAEYPSHIAEVKSEEFWSGFDANFEARIEFLANKIAPLIYDGNTIYFGYIGTHPQRFAEAMSLFEITAGQQIPEGQRGFLFNEWTYENMIKHRTARRLDQIKNDLEKDGLTIANSKVTQDKVKANVDQAAEVYQQINPAQRARLIMQFQQQLGLRGESIEELTREYLNMTDQNFKQRYDFFYREIAPHIILYKIRIGDVFPITSMAPDGTMKSLNVKVYGVFRFRGLEGSLIAGSFCLMDMVSFRDLFGFATAERREENRSLEEEMGLADRGASEVEALFSDKNELVQEAKGESSISAAEEKLASSNEHYQRRILHEKSFDKSELDQGIFLNAAVTLHDPRKIDKILTRMNEVIGQEKLPIQAVDFRTAAGVLGQFIIVVRLILISLVAVIFFIAAFVMMNSMLMAAIERKKEIGTMRAIGGQRIFLLRVILLETLVISLLFALVGIVLSGGIVMLINAVGITAQGDTAKFFFSGSKLHLIINWTDTVIVMAAITLIAIFSTLYPAWRAMKISPLEAMQTHD